MKEKWPRNLSDIDLSYRNNKIPHTHNVLQFTALYRHSISAWNRTNWSSTLQKIPKIQFKIALTILLHMSCLITKYLKYSNISNILLNTQLQDVIPLGSLQILSRTVFNILEDIHLALLLSFNLYFLWTKRHKVFISPWCSCDCSM